MGKLTVTVVGKKDLPNMKPGTVLNCEKETENAWDTFSIQVFDTDKTTELGYISRSPNTTTHDSVINADFYNLVPDKFTITVLRMDTIVRSADSKTVIVAEVETTINLSSDSSVGLENSICYKFDITGSSSLFPAKTKVLQEMKLRHELHKKALESGDMKHKVEPLNLTATLEDNKIVIYYEGEKAGRIPTDKLNAKPGFSSLEQLAELKNAMVALGDIDVITKDLPGVAAYTVECVLLKDSLKDATIEATKKMLEDIKIELVKKGFDRSILDNIENILLGLGLPIDFIEKWFNTFSIYPDDEQKLIPVWDDVKKYTDNSNVAKLGLVAISEGMSLNLVGEKGTGKNTFADWLLYLCQRPKHELSGNGQTSKGDILGDPTIESEITDAGQVAHKISYSPEQFVQAMGYKESDEKRHIGACALLDEVNGIPADILLTINAATDDRKTITVPQYGTVKAGENFFIIATMNVGYEGTKMLNEATNDRFLTIWFDNQNSIEHILKANVPTANSKNIQIANKIYQKIVQSVRNGDGELSESCVTIRGFIQALRLVPLISFKEALIRGVADKILYDDEYRKKVTEIIQTIAK